MYNGNFSWHEVYYEMPRKYRRMYVKLLVDQKKKEKEQIEKSGKEGQETGPGPYRPEGVPESSSPPKPSSSPNPSPNSSPSGSKPNAPQPSSQQASSPLSSEDAKKFRRKLKQMKEDT